MRQPAMCIHVRSRTERQSLKSSLQESLSALQLHATAELFCTQRLLVHTLSCCAMQRLWHSGKLAHGMQIIPGARRREVSGKCA